MNIVNEILERVNLLFDPNVGLFKFREDMLIEYYDVIEEIFNNSMNKRYEEVERMIEDLDNDIELELQQYITDLLNVSEHYYIDVNINRSNINDVRFILLQYDKSGYQNKYDIEYIEFDKYSANLKDDENFFYSFSLNFVFNVKSLCNIIFGYNDKEFKDFLVYLVSSLYHEIRHFYQSLKISIEKNLYNEKSFIVDRILSYNSNDYEVYFTAKFEIDSYAYQIAKFLYEYFDKDKEKIFDFLKKVHKYERIKNFEVFYYYKEVFGTDSEIYKRLMNKIYKLIKNDLNDR